MEFTTLCYIEKEDSYLMLHRTTRENDVNKDKWIGVGGHFETDESPEECLLREVREETGLVLLDWKFRGFITFTYEPSENAGKMTEYMCLYTADRWAGEMTSCDEGELLWVRKKDIPRLNLWEGDYIFLKLIAEDAPFFSLKLEYVGDCLQKAELNGKVMS